MNALEIINETVEYYKTNPRGLGEHSCVYKAINGSKCALGRAIQDKYLDDPLLNSTFAGGVMRLSMNLSVRNLTIEEVLKPEYRGQSKRFWEDLQSWHDVSSHWIGGNEPIGEPQKLTEKGEGALRVLIATYS